MSNRGSFNWLMGCGVVAAVIVLVLAVIGIRGCLYVKHTFGGIQVAQESYDALLDELGAIEDFVPAPNGAIPADHIERFLAIRAEQVPARLELEAVLADFPTDEMMAEVEEESVTGIIKSSLKFVAALVPPIADYATVRFETTRAGGMNLGEYLYIYSLAYFSFLGHDPAEGPVIVKDTTDDFEEKGERMFSGDDATFGVDKVRRRYRRVMKTMLENQLAALPAAGKMSEADRWRGEIQAELRLFASDPSRVAWERGLPEAAQASLTPFRERLERSYSPATNCFEMPLADGEDWKQWSR